MKFLRAIERLHIAFGVLSGMSILVITMTIVADVILRLVANQPVRGATEFSTLMMIVIVYIGLASVQASKSNFRMEIVIDKLPKQLQRVLNLVTTLIAMFVIGIMAWYTAQEAFYSLERREMSFAAISFPVYPARLIIALGLFLLTAQLLVDAIRLTVGASDDCLEGKSQ